jgi:hypothetical protein
MIDAALEALLSPRATLGRADVLARPSAVPARPGLYAWYFDDTPPGIPVVGCHTNTHGALLYVGISPGPPPANGKAPSRQNLYKRIRYHFAGNAAGSTLRLTLGCHLSESLRIELHRVGSGARLTFTSPGEAALSGWMARHARVAIYEHDSPWTVESTLISAARPPLNIDHNSAHPYYFSNRAMRAEHKARARSSPIWTPR